MNLSEKYRPKRLKDLVGHPEAIAILERVGARGHAFYITGFSGIGKTTIARILAAQVADSRYTKEVVGRQLKPDDVKEFADKWQSTTLFGNGGYALIVNESHGLSKPVIEYFLDILERIPDNTTIVFTTTNDGSDLFEASNIDAGPFASRCISIHLKTDGLSDAFAKRLKRIASKENLDGRPVTDYVELIEEHNGNLRAALNDIESGRMLKSNVHESKKRQVNERSKRRNKKGKRSRAALKAWETRRKNAQRKRVAG